MTRDWRTLHLLGGPVAFLLLLVLPSALLDYPVRGSLGLLVWMSWWWIFEPVNLAVTGFLPLVVLAIFNFLPVARILPSYAEELIFLLLGANILATVWTRWGLDRRIALVSLIGVGTSTRRQIMVWFAIATVLERVSPQHGRRRGDDPDRAGDAAFHRHRRHRQERVRIGAPDRDCMGNQRRRILDAARRRAEPADDQASPADRHFPRVPVHDLGHAAAAAHGRHRRRVLRVHVVRLQARDRSRRGQPRLFRSGAAFTGKDDSAGNVGPVVLSRRDPAGLHPPVLRIAPARIESLVRLSAFAVLCFVDPPSTASRS